MAPIIVINGKIIAKNAMMSLVRILNAITFTPVFCIDIISFIFYHFNMKTMEISDIDEMLLKLPKKRIQEIRDYISFLIEKEEKRKAFEKRVLKAKKGPYIECHSVEEFMQAIYNAEDEDD